MKNKVLIKLLVPEIDKTFDIFIPTNQLIWKIKKIIVNSINDINEDILDKEKGYVLINKENGQIYPNNITVYNSDIRNATEIILLQEK